LASLLLYEGVLRGRAAVPARKEADMNRMGAMISAAVVLLGLTSCSHQRAYFNYEDRQDEVQLRAGGWDGERLGVVRASEGGPVWKDCTEVAEASIWMLIQATREMGGNAIGEFRWVPQHPKHSSGSPTCRQRWGWVLIWPVLATPAFQSAGVEAVAYRVEDSEVAREDLYLIPESDEERWLLAGRIVSESARGK
jgi:hypothetical protein